MSACDLNLTLAAPAQLDSPAPGRKRVRNMMLVWALLGVVVGVSCGPSGAGLIGMVSGALAGAIVLFPLGLICALLRGQPATTLVGGSWGGIVMILAALWRGDAAFGSMSLGVLIGALTGATITSYVQATIWVISGLRQVARRLLNK